MKAFNILRRDWITGGLALALVLGAAPSARANVCATNIKLNGAAANAAMAQGTSLDISYTLNEPASSGVTIRILSGATAVRSIQVPGGGAGALKGGNTVSWNGRDDGGSLVPAGNYFVSVTAASVGYATWTMTSDNSAAYYVPFPRGGLAVNINSNSPYYGRVFVGNPKAGPSPGIVPADNLGVIKFNADGSYADEGAFGTGGYSFFDDAFYDVPRRLRAGQDDRLYILDWSSWGKVVAFDMTLSTNQVVLDQSNYQDNPYFAGFFYGWGVFDVTDAGTERGRVWLGNSDYPSAGIWVWQMTGGVADPTDRVGTQAAPAGDGYALSLLPSGGFIVDKNTNLWVAQECDYAGDPEPRIVVLTNSGAFPMTQAAWAAGGSDNSFRYNFDLAIDSRANPTYVAAAMYEGLGLRILSARDGSVVTNLNVGTSYRNIAWDAVGNLYATAASLQRWQVFSPPSGPNRATTPAPWSIQVAGSANPPQPPNITSIRVANGIVTVSFTGGVDDPAAAFTLLGSATVDGAYNPVADAAITGSAGSFQATTPTHPAAQSQFYRVRR